MQPPRSWLTSHPRPRSKRDRARAEFVTIFSKVIRERRASGVEREDMLQAFMEAEYKNNGGKLTDDQITGMLIGVLFAGQHTSSITTTWTIFNLLSNPPYLDRVMSEQAAVLGEAYKAGPSATAQGLSFDSVSKMDLLHLAMKETLRQYPPLIMLMRKTHAPLAVQNEKYTVPVGHYVFAVPAVAMNLPKAADGVSTYVHPEVFDPDRFAEPRKEDKAKKHAYTAFGGGIHACLGEQFGYLQVKTIVSILLRKFEITPVGTFPKPDYSMMVRGGDTPTVRPPATRSRTPSFAGGGPARLQSTGAVQASHDALRHQGMKIITSSPSKKRAPPLPA